MFVQYWSPIRVFQTWYKSGPPQSGSIKRIFEIALINEVDCALT